MLGKLLKFILLTLLAYLLQVTTADYIALWDVAPNIALAMAAIVTVALGRKYTFVMSMTIGYFIEIMIPSLDYINLLLYPVAAMLAALAFSDKSERKIEEERTQGRQGKQMNPHIRTPLAALLSIILFEGIHVFYIYLSGVVLDRGHWTRALIDVGYTTLLALVLQFPVRWWLGTYKLKKAR